MPQLAGTGLNASARLLASPAACRRGDRALPGAGSAEAVARTVAHTQGPAALHAAWCVVDEPELFCPSSRIGAAKIGPRSAVPKVRMSDADEFVLLAERYDDLSVLELDSARGLEARHPDANKLIEENAAICIVPALWHELKLRLAHQLCGTIIPRRMPVDKGAPQGWRSPRAGDESIGSLIRVPYPWAPGWRWSCRSRNQSRSSNKWSGLIDVSRSRGA